MIDAYDFMSYSPFEMIKPQMIMPNGQMEAPEDAGCKIRDILTGFLNSSYNECTLGKSHQVPCLRHDFGEQELKAIAKIMVF